MTVEEVFDALRGIPGVRSVPGGNGIAESALVAGIEIARASSDDERELRKLWRERFGGGPTPLLMLADEPGEESSARAVGPLSGGGPLRIVDTDDLRRVLERLPSLSNLQAVRELAEELGRLDRSGISGLQVKGLGTDHLFKTRLRASPRWTELVELAADAPAEWRGLLEALGYELERRRDRGYVAKHGGRRAAVVWPLADPAGFSKLDAEGRPPEGVLIDDCIAEGVPYGLLASAGRFRLFEATPVAGSAVTRYLELDAAALTEDDRPLLGLLAPAYLADGGFADVMREARDFGMKLRERVDRAIRQEVLPVLGRELGHWAASEGVELSDDRRRSELEAAALTFLFRALFLLYAESAGHLPMTQEAYRPQSLTQIVREAYELGEQLGERSTTLWGRVQLLVRALRNGDPARLVPPYNGALFAADGFEGADVLERASVPDSAFGPALVALGIDRETGAGYDFSGLEIGHLGHIYEGLLSLRLSLADSPYVYDAGRDRYVAADAAEAEIHEGDLLWLTDEGGRKGGGVYYTPEALVRHLVRRGVVPAFEAHLESVAEVARDDPEDAAAKLLDFRVLDPACGSAHFLVAVIDELADLVARFLGRTPLPAVSRQLDELRARAGETYGIGVEDVALLRRLVLKRCVYGVDLSPMGAEIAKISLWLASFVPGLTLAYLDHNIKVGNSLVGAADESGFFGFAADVLWRAIEEAADASLALFASADRTPDEVADSAAAEQELQSRVARARTLLDLWVAEPLGLGGARDLLWSDPEGVAELRHADEVAQAVELASEQRVFHWPLEFPEAFAAKGGFDAVVGNPPWDKIKVEEHEFYGRYIPGLRALAEGARVARIESLKAARPDLEGRYQREVDEASHLRHYFGSDTGYVSTPGDPDLYKLFCQRYRTLLKNEGSLALVLPRNAFANQGSTDFRRWLLDSTVLDRLDFLLNTGRWAFDMESRKTIALLVAKVREPGADDSFEVAGVASSESEFAKQVGQSGILMRRSGLGPLLEVPLLPSQDFANLLTKLREAGTRFPYGGGRWKCFPVRELDESDSALWIGAVEGKSLWKGESFDQYDPRGTDERRCPLSEQVLKKIRKPRPGSKSLVATESTANQRAVAVASQLGSARVAFRRISRANDSRTVRAALVPDVLLTDTAPYLAFIEGERADQLGCLGVMNSLCFDWQARRFVESHLDFFILEGLVVPRFSDAAWAVISRAAARLSCIDERFADFASTTGVETGPLDVDEHQSLRVEIDALVARAWDLDENDLDVIFADFTLDAVPQTYREKLRERLAELRRN